MGQPVTDEDVLIVYGRHQARLYPDFKPEQVIPSLSLYLLGSRKPRRVFRTGLGLSSQAMKARVALEDLAWDHGTEIYRVEQLEHMKIDAAYMQDGPCFICGDPVDHYGVPHGIATGDGRLRADIESEANRA
ncbi:hypothetical protein [Streptomyces sp. NPDC055036]